MRFEVRVPDLGELDRVDVVEVLVRDGDRVEADDALITLESDKASMDVPAPVPGSIAELHVEIGGQVGEGDLIAVLEVEEAEEESTLDSENPRGPVEADGTAGRSSSGEADAASGTGSSADEASAERTSGAVPTVVPAVVSSDEPASGSEPARVPGDAYDYDLLVLGSGPGGYAAAFRAADLGLRVALVERHSTLGGVCLNVGCIPSKALLHIAKVMAEARELEAKGIRFGEPVVDLDRVRDWKEKVVSRLTRGLEVMAEKRSVAVLQGEGRFVGPHRLDVTDAEDAVRTVSFSQAIVAAGSRPATLPGLPEGDARIVDSTGALALADIPERLLVVGGGIIGLEMASVYAALGSAVSVVELLPRLMAGCDADLLKPLERRARKLFDKIWVDTRVTAVRAGDEGLRVALEGPRAPSEAVFDRLLVAVGRRANGCSLGLDEAGVDVDERGVVAVDGQLRTNVPHILAIGDVTGEPMLAHRATHQGHVAAEVAAGHKVAFEARVIPSVAYTDPEIAWVGLGEDEAAARNIDVGVGRFPWTASGRALATGRQEGFTKLVFDPETKRLLGAGIAGAGAGDLISEVALAIEMGADAEDIALTVHPHPTLSETVALSAEAFLGTVTDLYLG